MSLNAIAEACGIRKSSVLHYFPTMNDLLTAVLAQRDLDEYKSGELMTSAMGRGDLRAHLRLPVQRNMENRKIIMLYAVLNMEATDPRHPAHHYFAERTRLGPETLEGLLDWKPDPPIAARQLLAFWQGLEALWVADSRTDPRVGCLLRRLLSMTPGHEPGVPGQCVTLSLRSVK